MHAKVLLVVQDIIECEGGADATGIIACTLGVTTILCLVGVQEVHGLSLCALHRETGGECQLRHEVDGGLTSGNQLVVVGAVVLGTGDIVQRTGDVHTVEVVVILCGVLGVHDGGVGGGVDYRHEHAATVGTVT